MNLADAGESDQNQPSLEPDQASSFNQDHASSVNPPHYTQFPSLGNIPELPSSPHGFEYIFPLPDSDSSVSTLDLEALLNDAGDYAYHPPPEPGVHTTNPPCGCSCCEKVTRLVSDMQQMQERWVYIQTPGSPMLTFENRQNDNQE